MGVIYVGVGEFGVSKNKGDIVKTMALGSCVGVIVMDPAMQSVGLLHVALPDSSINKNRVAERPGMFADTGIPLLLDEMKKLGSGPGSKFIVKLAGGASIMDPNNTFNIGKRNVLAIKKVLWKYKLGAISEDVGDFFSRTVSLYVDSGRAILSSPGRGEWEI